MNAKNTLEGTSVSSSRANRKRRALAQFADQLLSSPAGAFVAKMVLYGSLRKGRAKSYSDVDLLILATKQLGEIEMAASESALEIGLASGESIEPLVYSLTELRYPSSYFTYRNLAQGEEIYSMDEERIKREESIGYLELGTEYLDGARDSMRGGHYRLAVNAAYNAAELCAKGLLLFEIEELPSSHGGVVVKFAELFVKDGPLSRTLGRAFHRALTLRNKSRYDRGAEIGSAQAEEIIALAEEMIKTLDEKLSKAEK